jgi:hypothetical protein
LAILIIEGAYSVIFGKKRLTRAEILFNFSSSEAIKVLGEAN